MLISFHMLHQYRQPLSASDRQASQQTSCCIAHMCLQRLLILGWGDAVLMTDLLSELDHGPSALPKGSEVVLFNTRSSQEVMGERCVTGDIEHSHLLLSCCHAMAHVFTPSLVSTSALQHDIIEGCHVANLMSTAVKENTHEHPSVMLRS